MNSFGGPYFVLRIVERKYTNADEADACNIVQILFIYILGEKRTSKNPQCGSHYESSRCREKDHVFTDFPVGCEEHSSQLSFVAELRDKDGPEDC